MWNKENNHSKRKIWGGVSSDYSADVPQPTGSECKSGLSKHCSCTVHHSIKRYNL